MNPRFPLALTDWLTASLVPIRSGRVGERLATPTYTQRMTLSARALITGLFACLALVACTADPPSTDTTRSFDDSTPSASPSSSLPEGVIAVSLSEMSLFASLEGAPAGEVTFQIRNVGGLPHELVVIRTDQDAADLPVEDVRVVERRLDIVARSDHLASGQEATLRANLEPGHYVLICNLSGHYEQSQFGPGMRANFDVQ